MAPETSVGLGAPLKSEVSAPSQAFVIFIPGHEYSEKSAARCVETARTIGGLTVDPWSGVKAENASKEMHSAGLRWTWGRPDPELGLQHHSYGGPLQNRIGCAMSHYKLWVIAAQRDEPTLILEHDAVFVDEFEPFEFKTACMINDPDGATPHGRQWSAKMIRRGPGVWPKTKIFGDERPDGLAGHSAYVIQPKTAAHMVHLAREVGLWPNDALMCRQLVPDLEERYPFITKVQSGQSTTNP